MSETSATMLPTLLEEDKISVPLFIELHLSLIFTVHPQLLVFLSKHKNTDFQPCSMKDGHYKHVKTMSNIVKQHFRASQST